MNVVETPHRANTPTLDCKTDGIPLTGRAGMIPDSFTILRAGKNWKLVVPIAPARPFRRTEAAFTLIQLVNCNRSVYVGLPASGTRLERGTSR